MIQLCAPLLPFAASVFVACSVFSIFNPLTATIGRPLFGHKSRATRARELFKPSTDSASLLVDIEKTFFVFGGGFLEVTS